MAPPSKPSSVAAAFAEADYSGRVARAQDEMQRRGVDVLVLHGPANHRFFAGLDGLPDVRPVFLVITRDGLPAFVSPRIEAPVIRAKSKVEVATEWGEWKEEGLCLSFQDALAKHLHKAAPNAQKIGIDYNSITASNLELLKTVLGGVSIEDVSAMVGELRGHIDETALLILKAAAECACQKFVGASGAVAPGTREWKIAVAGFVAETACAAMHLEGDENNSPLPQSLTVTGSGPIRSSHAHSVASNRVMQDGEIVQICCCTPPLLGHDMCFDRPVKVGSAQLPENIRQIIDVARMAQEAALATVRPDATAGAVHDAAVATMAKHGFSGCMQHGTGRAIGCGGAKFRLMTGELTKLEAGMVLGVEPGVYVEGVGGARFGDTVLVTETGCEVLTDFKLGRDV
jgi:Xaa-Pro dipeptidase